MNWQTWLWQALSVIVVVVLVLALLNVLRARFRFDPVASISRPFYPPMPTDDAAGAGGGVMA